MAEFYATGNNRIVYRSVGFAAGLTVTAYIWNPALARSALQTFTEVELGLYYLDYDFASLGTYMGVFYEGGVAKASGVFRVTEISGAGAAAIADAVWDENPTGHDTGAKFGQRLANTYGIVVNLPNSGALSNLAQIYSIVVSTTFGNAALKDLINAISAAAIADAVWDELTADHQTDDTTGKALTDATEITLEED